MIKILKLAGLSILLFSLASCAGQRAMAIKGVTESADGLPIHFEAKGVGAPALVFVHGWCCDGSYWADQVEQFQAEHRVVTIDLGGHGASGLERETWSMEAFGDDVSAVVEELDLKDVILIGHSMGGPVICEAALDMPERVRGLVGVDTFQGVTLDLSVGHARSYADQFRGDFKNVTETWVMNMFRDPADSLLARQVARDMASAPEQVGVGALETYLIWFATGAAAKLSELQVPLRCINSDQPPTSREELEAIVSGYELRIVPGAGHFLHMEDPAVFNALLAEMIAGFEPR